MDCTPEEFREMYATYFGADSPGCAPFVGQAIPSSPARTLDRWGFQLDSAHMRIATFDACHDAVRDFLHDLAHEQGITVQWEPRYIFSTLIPAHVLLAPRHRGRPGIIPDLAFAAPMPEVATARHAPRGAPQLERMLLWDVKTIHSGHIYTTGPWPREDQSGAVASRAHRVWPSYLAHARNLDLRFHAPGTPIETRLSSYTPVRALVFGQYAEASQDVHTLLQYLARRRAQSHWRRYGARTEEEAYGFFIAALRRRVGVFVAREMARHRLRRLPFVGVSRTALDASAGRPPPAPRDATQIAAHEFYAYQVHADIGRLPGA